MIVRAVGAVALLLIPLSSESFAMRHQRPTNRMSCTEVRYYVAKYSEPAAEAWARSHGATEAEIEAARHCLNGPAASPAIQSAAQVTAR